MIWSGKENFAPAEHEDIIDAVAAHDAEAAKQTLIRHLERSRSLHGLTL